MQQTPAEAATAAVAAATATAAATVKTGLRIAQPTACCLDFAQLRSQNVNDFG